MGCMKSKQTFPFPTTVDSDQWHAHAEGPLPDERGQSRTPSQVISEEVNTPVQPEIVVYKFAHHLSQEILSDALKQWADSNTKYCDIPFIESEGP